MSLLNQFSIQLYSLREETAKDFAGVLQAVSEIGYSGVEFAGYGGLSAKEMRALLEKHRLHAVGSHVPLERLTGALEQELAYNREIGTRHIIVPWYDAKSEEDIRTLAGLLREIAPKVREAGFGFAYHNHAHEFATAHGRYLLDLLLQLVSANELDLELDLYWTAYAGVDYRAYLQKHANRIKLLHLKQMADFTSKRCVDLDEGVIDFREIIILGNKIGVEHYILEQEEFAESAYVSVRKGFEHIMSL